jgi:hypothetical protein
VVEPANECLAGILSLESLDELDLVTSSIRRFVGGVGLKYQFLVRLTRGYRYIYIYIYIYIFYIYCTIVRER